MFKKTGIGLITNSQTYNYYAQIVMHSLQHTVGKMLVTPVGLEPTWLLNRTLLRGVRMLSATGPPMKNTGWVRGSLRRHKPQRWPLDVGYPIFDSCKDTRFLGSQSLLPTKQPVESLITLTQSWLKSILD